MTQISDDMLEIDEHDIQEMLTSLDVCQKFKLVLSDEEAKWITAGLRELLSARETIRRLVKYTDHHSGCLSEASNRDGDCTCGYAALLAELEGKGFETAMKRVVGENIGAWKALGGDEEKG